MKCRFCYRDMVHENETSSYEMGDFIIFDTYLCPVCIAEFVVFHDTDTLVEYNLQAGNYRLNFNVSAETCKLETRDKTPMGTILQGWVTVIDFKKNVPQHVTPQNVKDKIKLFLVFS